MLPPAPHIVPPYCYRCPLGHTYPGCGVACADDLERTILMEGPESIAAFIAEPVIGSTVTAVVPVPEYYSADPRDLRPSTTCCSSPTRC